MSQRYEYAVSLRVRHPSIRPGLITRTLGLTPTVKKTAGAARRTPRGALLRSADGTLLGGVNPLSYWSAEIIRHGVGRVGRRSSAERHVERLCQSLRRHAPFLRRIHNDGGQVEIWVSSHSLTNYTFELTPACLQALAAAGVRLVIDVYPYRQNW